MAYPVPQASHEKPAAGSPPGSPLEFQLPGAIKGSQKGPQAFCTDQQEQSVPQIHREALLHSFSSFLVLQ